MIPSARAGVPHESATKPPTRHHLARRSYARRLVAGDVATSHRLTYRAGDRVLPPLRARPPAPGDGGGALLRAVRLVARRHLTSPRSARGGILVPRNDGIEPGASPATGRRRVGRPRPQSAPRPGGDPPSDARPGRVPASADPHPPGEPVRPGRPRRCPPRPRVVRHRRYGPALSTLVAPDEPRRRRALPRLALSRRRRPGVAARPRPRAHPRLAVVAGRAADDGPVPRLPPRPDPGVAPRAAGARLRLGR